MWTWFERCSLESFVNCFFRTQGACRNPKHNPNTEREDREYRAFNVALKRGEERE